MIGAFTVFADEAIDFAIRCDLGARLDFLAGKGPHRLLTKIVHESGADRRGILPFVPMRHIVELDAGMLVGIGGSDIDVSPRF